MVSIVGASNALQMRLSELAAFGLGRPANVLFSEYVTVLVARGVIDAATAERLSAGFYAAHYGDLNTEDLSVSETIVRLEDVTNRLAAMAVDARLELSERVQRDLQIITENVARSAITKAPTVPEPAWEASPVAAAEGPWKAEPRSIEFDEHGPFLSVAVPSADSDSKPRRGWWLNLLILGAGGFFFAGYAASDPIDKFVHRNDKDAGQRDGKDAVSPRATQEKPRIVDSQPPKEMLLRNWAVTEARLQQDRKASLAYELLLAYQPEDALTLNNLAWLYLTTNDAAVHNPQRGLELAMHAISLRRSAEFLDTAAEAHFQTGNPQEAVKLEKEAAQAQESGPFQRHLDSILSRQLQKFEAACKPRPPSSSTPPHTSAPTKAPAGASRGI
jgi:tetratricopeptide (TPR) repeat protein